MEWVDTLSEEQAPGASRSAEPEPVFAPEVPDDDRELLLSEPGVMVAANLPAVKPRSDLRASPFGTLGTLIGFLVVEVAAWGLVTSFAVDLLPDGAASWVSGGLGVIGLLFFALMVWAASTGRVESTAAYEYHGKYLHAKDWDAEAQRLMLRAQAAVRAVREAEVSKGGLLDDIHNDVVLPEQLWDLGQVLQKLSVLRARHRDISAGALDADLAGALGSQAEALRVTEEAMERKVATLEKYAEQVREADAIVRAEAALQEALRDDDGYIELLASTATTDQSRLVEKLSEEAVELKQQLTKSVAAALETGRALALPINDGPTT
ncbi:hypothetical protein Kfla_2201 [Kribbella flavida DSM 17836]|uniref:Uncharacterized protein n=1 Tax=Kribbella flavida (strain DSM 17836 / JCM 10339 / NBRC 14399) TaxID=479435 RepID=D2PTG6_KRIFD|nr:hypothetical protein [Kribbella flavida]ADB31279.1 hypothetical protein Kfla_2201 [Kribbella flavida DSM 17836]